VGRFEEVSINVLRDKQVMGDPQALEAPRRLPDCKEEFEV
jgi:hypothetical protein